MARFVARLRGGPFDGDSGAVEGTPPDRIYAWACDLPARCSQGGVHWAQNPEDAQFGAEIYEHEDRTNGVHVYVWRDIGADLGNFLREIVEEPVLA